MSDGARASGVDPRVAGLFRVWSRVYDAPLFQLPFYRRVHRRLLALLDPLPPPRRVVDLGCGTAQLTVDLTRRFPKALVVGVDLSREMLEAGRARGEAPLPLVQGDVYALPFADACVELVTSTLSFHWYLEPKAALAEVARVLRPGGHLVLGTLSSRLLRVAAVRWAAELGGQARVRLEPPEAIARALADAGLAVLRTGWVHPSVRLFLARRAGPPNAKAQPPF